MDPVRVSTTSGKAARISQLCLTVVLLVVSVLGCHFDATPLETARIATAAEPRSLTVGQNGKIVFASNERLYTINPDGSELAAVPTTVCEGLEPDWFPGGQRIGFIHRCGRSGTFDLAIVNVDGTGLRSLFATATDDARIDFSPTGSHVLIISDVSGNRDVYVMALERAIALGSVPVHNLTKNAATDDWPAWSPDGRFIAFTSNRGGDFDVYRMDADGKNVVNLTNHPANDGDPSLGGPSWSPDGLRIAFDSNRAGGRQVFSMDADGGNVEQLTTLVDGSVNYAPAWSADGQCIAFVSDRTLDRELWVMEADGSNQTQLTFIPGVDERPDW